MMPRSRTSSPLGALSEQQFLRRHWQKQPLFVRSALEDLDKLLAPTDLLQLASDERCRSRLVQCRGGNWTVRHGPFDPSALRRLPRRGWALLVQDVDLVSRPAHEVMQRFSFIPYARMDDLMVSLAPEGGGVGPHYDSYDVFLLQGAGSRRWEISWQQDRSLCEDQPLRILREFEAARSYDCRTGDLLYLPPGVPHHGIALETCMTWSVGFRAPAFRELLAGFLEHLEDGLETDGLYEDPGLVRQSSPARIPASMLRALQGQVSRLDLSAANLRRYLGRYLTEPQAHVMFQPPERPLSRKAFELALTRQGIELMLTSRMLWAGSEVFINGECVQPSRGALACLTRLADERRLPPDAGVDAEATDRIYEWYRAGYLLPCGRRRHHRATP